ncbi:LNS2 domain-containing protein [Ekhidna sp.]
MLFISYRTQLAGKKVVVFDIDNTISNTWPLLKETSKNYALTFKKAIPFPSIKDLIREYHSSDYQVLYLTARKHSYYRVTLEWIKKNDLPCKYGAFLVRAPFKKLWFLNKLIKMECSVIYYDDLSYNHENGRVKFYDNIVEEVMKLDLKFYGYEDLINIQSTDA